MIRRPPRSTLDRSSAASDVYKRQVLVQVLDKSGEEVVGRESEALMADDDFFAPEVFALARRDIDAVSYTHLRAHETVLDLVCRLLLEKKKTKK